MCGIFALLYNSNFKFQDYSDDIYEKINNINFDQKKVLVVKFENFCVKHNETSQKILEFLKILRKLKYEF